MEGQKSFKERVKETLISYAKEYKAYYVDYEYLLCSKAFSRSAYYIVSAHEDNYLHLTGVHTKLGASAFFQKCYDGTLEESDFDFTKEGQSESEVKGSVRRKINALGAIMDIFSGGTIAEEDFVKNRIRCALTTSNTNVTLGFMVVGKAKPMTLLKGNELDSEKAKSLDLVLRKTRGEYVFKEILVGSEEVLSEYKEKLGSLVTESLYKKEAYDQRGAEPVSEPEEPK